MQDVTDDGGGWMSKVPMPAAEENFLAEMNRERWRQLGRRKVVESILGRSADEGGSWVDLSFTIKCES